MLKKILVGTLIVGVIGALVVGAVIRTMSRTEVAQARGQGYGRGLEGTALDVTSWGGGGYRGGQEGQAVPYEANSANQGRGGRWGGRQGSYGEQSPEFAPGDGTGNGQAQVDEWLTLQGSVVSVDENAMVLQTAEGEQVVVENRGWWFAQEQGFSTMVGNEVSVTGFYEADDFEVGQVEDLTSGQAVFLRDETGRPMWAGARGRRGG